MPVETWTEVEFSRFYQAKVGDRAHAEFGRWFGYTRLAMAKGYGDPRTDSLDRYAHRWRKILRAFPAIGKRDRMLIVGCAFGWTIEAAHAAGYPNVYGIDSSPYCEASFGTEGVPATTIVWSDFRAGGVPSALRRATGADTFDWIITEDVVSCYDDADVTAMAPVLEGLLAGTDVAQIIHMTSVNDHGDPDLNWKGTIEEWAALIPTHSWTDPHGVKPV